MWSLVLDLNIFFGIITVVAFIAALAFGIYQLVQAKNSDKKLEEAKENLRDLEEGLLLSDFKLRKATEFYEQGHYKNALELFKKYSLESDDLSEFKEAIRKIFWKETRKIYSKYMGKGWSTEILVMTIVAKSEETDSTYPDFMNDLLNVYTQKSGVSLASWRVPVLLNQSRFDEVSDYLSDFRAQRSSKKANESFREFLDYYCKRQLIET